MEAFCNIITRTILFFVYPIAFIAGFVYNLSIAFYKAFSSKD